MPETRVERGLFVLGLVAIAALGFLIAHLWHHTKLVAASPGTTARPIATGTTAMAKTAARSTTRARATTSSATSSATRATTTAPAAAPVVLQLRAKVDTWIEVRSGSATGSVLYSGTLPARSTRVFHARSLWARLAAGGNLSARLDGKAVQLPSGTYDAIFDVWGFRRAP